MTAIQILENYELVNHCETVKELEDAILKIADEHGMINGRTRIFNAKEMSDYVKYVVDGTKSPSFLTREFGIRQQALYIRYYR